MHYLTGHHDEVTGVIVSPKNKLQVCIQHSQHVYLLFTGRYSEHLQLTENDQSLNTL